MNTASLQIRFALPACVLLFMSMCAFGQTPGTGAIAGNLYDPASKTVSGAEVVAVSQAMHIARTAISTQEGSFELPLLPPGSYIVTVKAPGFTASISDAVRVAAGEIITLNLSLTLASVTQSVQVNSRAEEADLESSTLGGLVDPTTIQMLPLSNRNYTQILGLSPAWLWTFPMRPLLATVRKMLRQMARRLFRTIFSSTESTPTILLKTPPRTLKPTRAQPFPRLTRFWSFACKPRISTPPTGAARGPTSTS